MFKKILPIASWSAILAVAAMAASVCAHSATIFETTELAGATPAADATLPQPITFQIATAGSYTVTLTDLRIPGPLGSLKAIVAHDLQTAAQLEVTYPAAPAVPVPATQAFMATPGTYRLHVLGIPRAGEAGGGFFIGVEPTAGGAAVVNHAGVIAAESLPGTGQSALQTTFEIEQAGTYQLTLTDHAFPVALTSIQALLLQETASGPPVPVTTTPDPIATPGMYQFTATPGTYQLVVVATAPGATLAGLYSVRIAAGSASPVYRSVQPVGLMPPAVDVVVTTAGQYSLTLADANFPASLVSMGVAVMQGDALLGMRTTAGTSAVTAASGSAQLYALATPAAAAGVGAFTLQLAQGSVSLYEDVRIADVSADPTTPAIFAIQASNPIAAGTYRLTVEDFALPLAFASLRAAVAQGAAVLGTLNNAGNAVFTVQSGPLKVLVAATPPVASGNALFGMTFVSTPDGAVAMETTQGVGGLFRTYPVSIPATGEYDLTLTDLKFPAALKTAALAITRGTTLIGQIFGGGTVPRQRLSAGTYVLNFLGEPAAAASYGAYGLRVADSPPQPTVMLSANPASITSGQQTTLQWSSTDATVCTASNAWTGSKAISGSQPVGPLNANATFDMSCTGPGGTGTASVAVTVTAPSANSGGGGGALGLWGLIYMCVLGAVRYRRSGLIFCG